MKLFGGVFVETCFLKVA